MEKRFYKAAFAAYAMIAVLSLTGCQEKEQAGTDPITDPDPDTGAVPVLAITTEDNMPVSAEGGPYTIEYTLENEVSGGSVSASCPSDIDWVKDFNVGTSGKVSFTVSPNDGSESRSAVITVTYTYGEGDTASDGITVVQSAPDQPEPEPADPPVITAIMASRRNVPYTGESGLIAYYSIENSVVDGVVSISTQPEADWIEVTDTFDDRLILSIGENAGSEERTVVLRLRYTYGDNEYVESEQTMTIVQAGIPAQADYEFVATAIINGAYSPGFAMIGMPASFSFTFSSSTDTRLTYDVYMSADAELSSGKTIPSGNYVYESEASEAGTFGHMTYVTFEDGSTKYITGGAINVVNNGDGTYGMEANFIDEDGKSHHITFSGSASF